MNGFQSNTHESLNGSLGAVLLVIITGFLVAVPGVQAMPRSPQVDCRVETDRSVLPANGPQKVVVKVTLDAPPPPKETARPPVNLAIVLDRSSSMSGRKIAKAKEAAIEALKRLGPKDTFSLVAYSHTVETIVPAQSARNVEWIKSRIRSIQPGGFTALFGGVSQAASEIRKNLGKDLVHRIILLSDGLANRGPSTPAELGRLGASLIKEGISLTTVGVGTDYNEDLMTQLSQKSDGNTYFVESSADLPRIFAAELGDVLSVVAKKVNVNIEFPEGVRPITIIGREGRIKGRTVALSLNQLYGGQAKYVLLEAETPGAADGKSIEIASARVSYENPFTRRRETSTGRAKALFSSNQARVEKSANLNVQKHYELNLHARAQEAAISLADKGKTQEAAQKLRESGQQLKKLGKKFNDPVLLDKAQHAYGQAQTVQVEGMSKKNRKELRTDSFQTQNQQRMPQKRFPQQPSIQQK
jgi:Ca-activated chloride channel homolog